jgi:hypothetical protein
LNASILPANVANCGATQFKTVTENFERLRAFNVGKMLAFRYG